MGQTVSVRLGLKIRPDEMLSTAEWRIAIEKDVRLAALVSMLKAAHAGICSKCSATGMHYQQGGTS